VHLTSNPIDWYAARAAGIAAYLMLTCVVVLGLTMAGKKNLPRWPKFAIEDVHRFAGLLVGSFVIVHVVTIAIDSWLPFSIGSILVPLLAQYRPLWVALGIVAAELLLALAITNHYRDRLPYRFWRRAHYLNFVVWSAATLHGIGSGTDRSASWLLALFALATVSVSAAIAWRLTRRLVRRRSVPLAGVAAAATALLVIGLGAGPLHFSPKPWNAVTFTESLTGQITQLSGVTRGIISMTGQGTGTQRILVRADLLLKPRGIEQTAFQMEYLPSGLHCNGTVTKAKAFGFDATCRLPNGTRRIITAQWPGTGTADIGTGTITSQA
jgi:methionine sulfoxide reductase heme-binding subunit